VIDGVVDRIKKDLHRGVRSTRWPRERTAQSARHLEVAFHQGHLFGEG